MHNFRVAASAAAFLVAMTAAALAQDAAKGGGASETADHSGKTEDGKTNGMSDSAAGKAGLQDKTAPKVESGTAGGSSSGGEKAVNGGPAK